MTEDDKIIKEEIDTILDDIRKLYRSSGKKASGEFEKGLEAIYEPNKGTIRGFVYLAGRKAGKMPPIGAIMDWLKIRGIRPIRKNQSVRSIAFAIAKKIAKEGTRKESVLKIYEQIITPQRINKIIDRVARLNVNRLITEITAELEVLAKNV